MRTQPLHKGHCWIIGEMLQEAETVIVGLGSADKAASRSNPFTVDLRIEQIKNVFGKRVKCIPFNDLGATPDKSDWIDYILQKIENLGLPSPTDYYTGSRADAIWYSQRFYSPLTSKDTWDVGLKSFRTGPDYETIRHLHIMDRDSNSFPSATELRAFIELRSDEWKQYVPAVNHKLIEENYPTEFLVG
jgi:cytidyltransferase-like protein